VCKPPKNSSVNGPTVARSPAFGVTTLALSNCCCTSLVVNSVASGLRAKIFSRFSALKWSECTCVTTTATTFSTSPNSGVHSPGSIISLLPCSSSTRYECAYFVSFIFLVYHLRGDRSNLMGEDIFHLGIKALIRKERGEILLLHVDPAEVGGKEYW